MNVVVTMKKINMTNKYLEKIAEQKKEPSLGKKIGALLLGSTAAALPLGALNHHLTMKVMNAVDDNHSHANLGTIKKMMRDNKLNTSFNTRGHYVEKHMPSPNSRFGNLRSAVTGHVPGPMYMPSSHMGKGNKNFIMGVKGGNSFEKKHIKNKDVIMHELGHAKDFTTHGKLKLHSNILGKALGSAAPLLLLNKKTEDYATPVAALAAVPVLRSEAMANYHAYKGIQAHKGSAAAKGFAKKLLPSQMGAYAATAAAGVGGVYAGKKIIDRMRKNRAG